MKKKKLTRRKYNTKKKRKLTRKRRSTKPIYKKIQKGGANSSNNINEIFKNIEIKRYGVLGTSIKGKKVEKKVDVDWKNVIIVDPAGSMIYNTSYFRPGGASKAIYDKIKYLTDTKMIKFIKDDKEKYQNLKNGSAFYKKYEGKGNEISCIHIIGPNGKRKEINKDKFIELLIKSYTNVFEEFIKNTNDVPKTLYLLPISSDIFRIPNITDKQMAEITINAIYDSLNKLNDSNINKNNKIYLCIYKEHQFEYYSESYNKKIISESESEAVSTISCKPAILDKDTKIINKENGEIVFSYNDKKYEFNYVFKDIKWPKPFTCEKIAENISFDKENYCYYKEIPIGVLTVKLPEPTLPPQTPSPTLPPKTPSPTLPPKTPPLPPHTPPLPPKTPSPPLPVLHDDYLYKTGTYENIQQGGYSFNKLEQESKDENSGRPININNNDIVFIIIKKADQEVISLYCIFENFEIGNAYTIKEFRKKKLSKYLAIKVKEYLDLNKKIGYVLTEHEFVKRMWEKLGFYLLENNENNKWKNDFFGLNHQTYNITNDDGFYILRNNSCQTLYIINCYNSADTIGQGGKYLEDPYLKAAREVVEKTISPHNIIIINHVTNQYIHNDFEIEIEGGNLDKNNFHSFLNKNFSEIENRIIIMTGHGSTPGGRFQYESNYKGNADFKATTDKIIKGLNKDKKYLIVMGTCASNYFVDEINRMNPPNIAAMSLVQFPGGEGESTNTQYLKFALSILVSLFDGKKVNNNEINNMGLGAGIKYMKNAQLLNVEEVDKTKLENCIKIINSIIVSNNIKDDNVTRQNISKMANYLINHLGPSDINKDYIFNTYLSKDAGDNYAPLGNPKWEVEDIDTNNGLMDIINQIIGLNGGSGGRFFKKNAGFLKKVVEELKNNYELNFDYDKVGTILDKVNKKINFITDENIKVTLENIKNELKDFFNFGGNRKWGQSKYYMPSGMKNINVGSFFCTNKKNVD